MSTPQFLPWLRQGLARGISGADPRSGPLPVRPAIEASVTLEDSRGTQATATSPLAILGPGDVAGIDPAQIVRREPVPGARDVDWSLLPAVELAAPDLPWLLTPAAPDGREGLRPWLVLVCVEERDGVEYVADGPTGPVLRVSADAVPAELPDLADSWAWAHVQSMVPAAEIAGAVAGGAVVARLLAPRRLAEARRYRAALVPAFAAPQDGATELLPAWDVDAPAPLVVLPVLDTWTFTTATTVVNFEALCRRLEPDDSAVRLGLRAAEVVDRGLLEPFAGDTGFEYEGALRDPGASGKPPSRNAQQWLDTQLRGRLDETAARPVVDERPPADYDPERDDPVIGPPLYGAWAAARGTVPAGGWVREANLVPARRAAAGLGARVVREHDDEFLAAAWDQAGDVRALREEVNRARLAAEVGRSHARRLATLDDAALLGVTARLHLFYASAGTPLSAQIRASAVFPAGLVSAPFLRQTRPGSVLARRARADRAAPAALGARVTDRFLEASAPAAERGTALEACARFGAGFHRPGSVATDTVFSVPRDRGVIIPGPPAVPAKERELELPADDDAEPEPHTPVPLIESSPADDLRAAGELVRANLDPMPAVVAGLAVRVAGLDLSGGLPARVAVGPRFPDALFPKLAALGTELVLPGVADVPEDRVRLVEVNEEWIAAFLVGANHEWAREALWNEYPADLGATSFSTFWQRVPAGDTDIDADLHDWPVTTTLRSHVGGPGASTVLLVRGLVVRRVPGIEFFLVTPAADGTLVEPDGSIPAERTTWPSFAGTLDAGTVFVGFDVAARVIRDEGRYVALQEPVTGPRFGFDAAGTTFGKAPAGGWADLTWGHVTRSAAALAALGNLRLRDTSWLDRVSRDDGVVWGRNGAHMAGIAFQQPFRLLLAASDLLPEPS